MSIFWEIATPVLILLAAGVIIGLLLTVCARAFAVKTDPKVEQIRAALPGINCGACGYSGCDDYAEKAASGEAPVGLCVPGADQVSAAMSDILGVDYVDVVEKKAFLACNSCKKQENQKYDYRGIRSCKAAVQFYGGDRACRFGCLGFGDCADACDFKAITLTDGLPVFQSASCTGCGKCVKICPRGCISLRPETQQLAVACSNHETGRQVMAVCKSGCIGCKKCEKNCPNQAIRVEDNCAVIIPESCTGCGLCAENCPTKCISRVQAAK